MDIEVWFGDGDRDPLGPISAKLISQNGDEAKFQITDEVWLDHVGWGDEPYTYTCNRLPPDRFVSYDDYAWCPVGEGGQPTKWW